MVGLIVVFPSASALGLATRSKVYEAQHLDLLRHREGEAAPLVQVAHNNNRSLKSLPNLPEPWTPTSTYRSLPLPLPAGKPLITIANHASCIDDPFLWGLQSWAECFQPRLCRWLVQQLSPVLIHLRAHKDSIRSNLQDPWC